MKSLIRRNSSFLLFLLAVLFVRTTLANQYLVPSGSMEPTLVIGDRIAVNRVAYDLKLPFTQISVARLDEPQRGDIVVFESPRDEVVMVKRLIGLPGDELEIIDGRVWVNGERSASLDTEDLGQGPFQVQRIPELMRPHHIKLVVPEGEYFMMGDNRDNSSDSRVWGTVPRSHLIGRAQFVLYSVPELERTGMDLD